MPNPAEGSLRRGMAMLAAVLVVITAGTGAAIKWTTDRLIHADARANARDWADFLAANVADLKQIAAGEMPSDESTALLESTRKSGKVFRYVIFNRFGYSQFVADREHMASLDFSEFSAEAKQAVAERRTIIDTASARTPDLPAFYARAYVPVIVGDRPIGAVAAFVDETEHEARFRNTFLVAAVSLCGLTALAFGIPAIAWYRRTKEKEQSDRHIRYLAHHDALTGLVNRPRLIERLESKLASLSTPGVRFAVHFVDLDFFKNVNDAWGHDGGDFLLETVAERLRARAGGDDFVARLGGDEFVVVQSGISEKAEAEAFAHRIVAALSKPVQFLHDEIAITSSVGVAIAPDDGDTSERMLKSADIALYVGKSEGRDCVRFFDPRMDEALQARLALERTIREAVATGGFELHYQPVIEVNGNQVVGYEALVRLPAPDGSLIPPNAFIPLAEEMRLIDKVGAWVLREACRTASAWPEHITIAVNLSPAQFESGTICNVVADALAESGLEARRLELEITERLLLGNDERTMTQLLELKVLGAAIVMDDFGTG